MPNLGKKQFEVMTDEGTEFTMAYQCAEVSKGLTSVGDVCDVGDGQNFVVFTKTGGYIASPQTGSTVHFSRKGPKGPYVMRTWVKRPDSDFARRG